MNNLKQHAEQRINVMKKVRIVNELRDAGLPVLAEYAQRSFSLGIPIDQIAGWLESAARIMRKES